MSVSNVNIEQFSATHAREGNRVNITLKGSADLAALQPLGDFLRGVFEDTRRSVPAEVAVDLRNLEFMNSSCFKAFVVWLTRVSALDKAQQYGVRFLGSSTRHWQKRSLAALSCFAADLVKVEM